MTRVATKLTSVLSVLLVVALASPAEARRGGSFGSRGMRTYQAAPPTRTSQQATAPVQRTMTAPPKAAQPGATAPAAGAAATQAQPRRGMFGGMGGALLGGLVAGGLIGMLMGHGWGGLGAGLGNTLMQLALVGLAGWMLYSLFRRRRPQAAAAGMADSPFTRDTGGLGAAAGSFSGGRGFAAMNPAPAEDVAPQAMASVDIGLVQADRDAFERLLAEVQDAFGREDYAALRARTTPEIMSYLSEELSTNATQGRRNEVTGTRLLQADVAEAWREGDTDYSTAALRYESIDVMRDRQSGAVVEGDPARATETTELWTFVRTPGADWKLSAIQEA